MSFSALDQQWMRVALQLAESARDSSEVPVGAVVVRDGEVIGRGANRPLGAHDPTAHAEIIALRDAGDAVGNYRLAGCQLFVTLEPCMMCVGAMVHARIDEVVFAASDPKSGALGGAVDLSLSAGLNHQLGVRHGLFSDESAQLLRTFFRERR